RTPADLLLAPAAGEVPGFQPELSGLAGSLLLPVGKWAVTPPTRDAAPAPKAGAVVPVVVLPSGMGLLKFHWAITPASGETRLTKKKARESSAVFMAPGLFPFRLLILETQNRKQSKRK